MLPNKSGNKFATGILPALVVEILTVPQFPDYFSNFHQFHDGKFEAMRNSVELADEEVAFSGF
jgi:hypothetical protein